MKVHIDKKRCIGCEACINHCPVVFLTWGMHMKADFDVPHPERYGKAVADAVDLCPQQAISCEP